MVEVMKIIPGLDGLPTMWETWVQSLGQEDLLEKEMAIYAWEIPWVEEPGRLQSMGSQRVAHDFTFTNEDDGDLPQKVPCTKMSRARTAVLSAPNPAAGHHQPTPLPGTPGHSGTNLGQSLVGSVLLSPGSWCTQGFVCTLQESVSSVLCKFCRLYGGVNGDLLQEGLCRNQVYCTQSPRPYSCPLLTCTSAGDTQTQFCLSLCGGSGSWCTQGLFKPSEHLWWVWGLIVNVILSLLLSCWASPLPLDVGYLLKFTPALYSRCSRAYHLAGASLPLDMGFLLKVTPVLCKKSRKRSTQGKRRKR